MHTLRRRPSQCLYRDGLARDADFALFPVGLARLQPTGDSQRTCQESGISGEFLQRRPVRRGGKNPRSDPENQNTRSYGPVFVSADQP